MKRREFLHKSLLSMGGIGLLGLQYPTVAEAYAFSVVKDIILKAQAEALAADPTRNYISVLLYGAPNRYCFDQWVRTNPEDPNVTFNEMGHTKLNFANQRLSGSEPGYFNHRGMLIPHMFSTAVNTSAGSQPLTQLADNMAVIRGYGSGLDGHPTNAIRQMAPVSGLPSITGAVADANQKLFSAVGYPGRGTTGTFASQKSMSLNVLGNTNPLHQLMQGFGSPPANQAKARSIKQQYEDIYERASAQLKHYANSSHTGHEIVARNHQSAMQLIKRGIDDINSFWGPTVAKYKNAFEASARAININGISTAPLLNNATFANRMMAHSSGRTAHGLIHPEYDLRLAIANMTDDFLLNGFALAEYLIKNNLSSAIELWSGRMTNVPIHFAGETSITAGHVPFDMHEWGVLSSTLVSSAYFRGVSALILELKNSLQGQSNLWDETVVHVFSEFGRSGRTNGNGSDHGFNSMVSSLFSGAIKQPMIVGNALTQGYNASYTGAQAIAAPIAGYNQSGMPSPALLASTLSEVLRLPANPWRNLAEPLLLNQNQQIVYSSFGKGRLVGS